MIKGTGTVELRRWLVSLFILCKEVVPMHNSGVPQRCSEC